MSLVEGITHAHELRQNIKQAVAGLRARKAEARREAAEARQREAEAEAVRRREAEANEQKTFCTNCGEPVSKQAFACTSCGAKPVGHKKFCKCCGVDLNPEQIICIKCGAGVGKTSGGSGSKNKFVAALLAFFLGFLGVHWFYLGEEGWGVTYIFIWFLNVILAISLDAFGLGLVILGIIILIDTFKLLLMSDEDFNMKYNTYPKP